MVIMRKLYNNMMTLSGLFVLLFMFGLLLDYDWLINTAIALGAVSVFTIVIVGMGDDDLWP